MKRVLVLVALGLSAQLGFAFQLLPMNLRLAPTGQNATGVFRVVNETAAPVAVQVTVTTREMRSDGTEENEDAGTLFQVFPAQMIVPPGSQQSVRVRYLGPAELTSERAFRLVAEQMPIALNRDNTPTPTVQFVLRYRATLYVAPAGVAARLQTRILRATADELELEVQNAGTRHQILDGSLVLAQGDRQSVLALRDIPQMNGQNVLAGGVRLFAIDHNSAFVPDTVSLRPR